MDYKDKRGYYYSDGGNDDTDLKRSRNKKAGSHTSRSTTSRSTSYGTSRNASSSTSRGASQNAYRNASNGAPPNYTQRNNSNGNTPSRSSRAQKMPMEKRLKQKQRKLDRKRAVRKTLFGFFLISIICVIIGTGVFVGMYTAVSREIDNLNIKNLSYSKSSTIYYIDNNNKCKQHVTLSAPQNITWLDYEDINDNMKNAIVAIEDERFYKHNGVDFKRTTGALFKYALSKIGIGDASYGGSTLTQQVIKNLTEEKDKTSTRKAKEIMRAMALEKKLSKEEILTLYLNIAYFSNGCYGVGAASQTYFSKNASDLSIEEAALIAGITQFPSKYDPIANPNDSVEKRNRVLKKMYELNMISKAEYDEAKNSELDLSVNKSAQNENINSYFVEQLVNEIVNDLQEKHGYSSEYAKRQLYNGGLTIYSTIDPNIQKFMEAVYENTNNFPGNSLQSAMTIIDPYTGEIKGLVGGTGHKTANYVWNRASQTKRQPGSAIKPLSAYAPAIEENKLTQGDILEDKEITIKEWTPTNSYKGYLGKMLPVEAVGRSVNTIPISIMEDVGVNKAYKYVTDKFHLSNLDDRDKNYASLALGGLTQGATTIEMAAAYATFVNSGKYITPHTYTKVVDNQGSVLLEKKVKVSQAISSETAYIMSDLLLAPVNEEYGTATDAKLPNMTTYGKTGTTDENFDKWFVGFTRYYVGAVWSGYDSPQEMKNMGNPSISVWRSVMSQVHSGLENKKIPKPKGVTEVEICPKSGLLPKSSCNKITAYFENGTEPKKTCSSHSGSSKKEEDKEKSEAPKKTEKPKKSEKPEETQETTQETTQEATQEVTPTPTQAPTPIPTPEQPVEPPTPTPSPADTGGSDADDNGAGGNSGGTASENTDNGDNYTDGASSPEGA